MKPMNSKGIYSTIMDVTGEGNGDVTQVMHIDPHVGLKRVQRSELFYMAHRGGWDVQVGADPYGSGDSKGKNCTQFSLFAENRINMLSEDIIYMIRDHLNPIECFKLAYSRYRCEDNLYPCSKSLPQVPGCCYSLLIAEEDRLKMTALELEDFPPCPSGYGMRLSSELDRIHFKETESYIHLYLRESTVARRIQKDSLLKLARTFCSNCHPFLAKYDSKFIMRTSWQCNCPNKESNLRFYFKGKKVGLFPEHERDLQNLLEKNGNLQYTMIDEPHLYNTINTIKFDFKNFTCQRTLLAEYISLGGLSEHAQDKDYSYDIRGDIIIQDLDSPGVVTREIRLVLEDYPYKKLCAIRHDFVSDMLSKGTDTPLSVLGIDINLTPDHIDDRSRTVLELSTNGSGVVKSMESSYINKRISYESVLSLHGVTYLIIVVSPFSIMSNLFLRPHEVTDLCSRCRIGLGLELKIEEELGIKLIGTEEERIHINKIRNDFSTFNNSIILLENDHFNKDLFRIFQEKGEDEDEHVDNILHHTLLHSLRGAEAKSNPNAMSEYMSHFTPENTRLKAKLITIFPLVYMRPSKIGSRGAWLSIGANKTCPSELYKIFQSGLRLPHIYNEHNSSMFWHLQALSASREESSKFKKGKYNVGENPSFGKHVLRQEFRIEPLFQPEELHSLALQGVGAKNYQNDEEVLAKELDNKWSFHPDTDTSDIEEFWSKTGGVVEDPDHIKEIEGNAIYSFLFEQKSKDPLLIDSRLESSYLVNYLRTLEVVQLGELISDIVTEISMEYKVATRPGEWLVKPLRNYKGLIALYCTGTHTFWSCCFEKSSTTILETGRLGPRLYETENYYITDVVSISENGIEHFLKAGEYILLIASHLVHSFKLPVLTNDWIIPDDLYKTLNYLTLTYLNNKIDHEEMITNLRFLYMKLLQETGSNVNDYVDRLPDVLKSRLSVFTLNRIKRIMDYYSKRRLIRRSKIVDDTVDWEYKNLYTIFSNAAVTLDQLIDSFYYSYVITKNKSAIGDGTFKIFEKVIREETKGTENVIKKGKKVWGMLNEPEHHRWDYALERRMIQVSLTYLVEKHGPLLLKNIENKLFQNLARIKFSDMATLKASAKNYELGQKIPEYHEGMTRKEYLDEFKKLNPELKGKRPRVITTLNQMIAKYMEETKIITPEPIKVALWAVSKLMKRGFCLSDLFIKDQHNGVREIHVLEILARMMQYIVENIAKTICQFFDNDSVCSPETKTRFYYDHEKESEAELGKHITYGKSADASKWCQRNHVSQFFFEMLHFTPTELHKFLYCAFYLWTKKRIAVDPKLLDNFDRNVGVKSSNDSYLQMMEAYHKGFHPFLEKRSGFIEINFGMFQGIMHDSSCLKHDITQTHWAVMTREFISKTMKLKNKVTHIQGSDDSGALISIPVAHKGLILIILGLLWWKESLSAYSSIWTSKAKTSVGTANLLEYNSDWYYYGRNIKPLFRWNSACLETSLVERLPDRVETFYNSLSQSLETGSSTLLCSIIQLCQASLHYRMIGIGTHLLSKETLLELGRTKQVSLGYFPLEQDHLAGITGFDFQLYSLAKQGVAVNNWELETHKETEVIEYDSRVDKIIRNGLKSFCIRFSNIKHYEQVVKETGLPKLTSLLEKIEKNPELLYINLSTWEQEEIKMILALENPMVRSSLSAYQPTARMMAASSYLIGTPCVSGRSNLGLPIKKSLLGWLKTSKDTLKVGSSVNGSDTPWFCNQNQYESFREYIIALKDSVSYQRVSLKRKAKIDLVIWGNPRDVEIPLMDILRRKWFNVKTVHCSQTIFNLIWNNTKIKFPFLEDTYMATKKKMNLEDIILQKFMLSISEKIRTIHLQDTTGKSSSVWNTVTRLHWPDTKVRSFYEISDTDGRTLKHGLHCILSYFLKPSYALAECENLIVNSKSLSKDIMHIPSHLMRLKIFQMFFTGAPKLDIIQAIERSKLGIIGYFRKRQDKTKEGYTGSGEWTGQIGGVDVIIKMEKMEVVEIRIQRLSDIEALSRSLKSLISNFKLSFPKDGWKKSVKIYLTSEYGIERLDNKQEFCCPIKIEHNMKLDLIDKLVSQKWYVEADEPTLRLIFTEPRGRGYDLKFTILSESFGSSTWDPLLPSPNLGDENFSNWCKGCPVKPMILLNQLMIPTEIRDIIQLKVLLKNESYFRPDTKYDLEKFLKHIKLYIDRRKVGRKFHELKDYKELIKVDQRKTQPLITQEEINVVYDSVKKFTQGLNLDSKETDDLIELWTKEEEDDPFKDLYSDDRIDPELEEMMSSEYSYEDDPWDISNDAVEEIRNMFSLDDDSMDPIKERIGIEHRHNLQQLEAFLSPFSDIFDDMPNVTAVLESLKLEKNDKSVPLFGIGGVLIYLTSNIGFLKTIDLRPSDSMHDVGSQSDYLSLSASQGILNRSLADINLEIQQIGALMPTLREPVLTTMKARLKRLISERIWMEKRDQISNTSRDLSRLDKATFLKTLYSTLLEKNLYVLPVEGISEETTIELFLSYSLEAADKLFKAGFISRIELEDIKTSVSSPLMNEPTLQAISMLIGHSLTIKLNDEILFEYFRGYFKGHKEIRISVAERV
nr:MAG: RNA-dependent RNA polymerase [Guangxi phenui-like virus]